MAYRIRSIMWIHRQYLLFLIGLCTSPSSSASLAFGPSGPGGPCKRKSASLDSADDYGQYQPCADRRHQRRGTTTAIPPATHRTAREYRRLLVFQVGK